MSEKGWYQFLYVMAGITLTILPLSFFIYFTPTISLKIAEVGLLLILLLFYIVGFFTKISISLKTKKIIIGSALVSILLLSASLLGAYPPQYSTIFRVLIIIWSIPFLAQLIATIGKKRMAQLLLIVVTLHSLWAIAQFVLQDDVGLYRFGETQINVQESGIAKFQSYSDAAKLIRAYGPYPHPNILAGTLVLTLMATLMAMKKNPQPLQIIMLNIIFIALLTTFSRAALISVGLFLFYYLWQTKDKKYFLTRLFLPFLIITLTFTPWLWLRLTDNQDAAVEERLDGLKLAWKLIEKLPWWQGVGPGNYTHALRQLVIDTSNNVAPWQIDFVHSVPLLVFTEVGLLITGWFLGCTIVVLAHAHKKNIKLYSYGPVIFIVPIILLDHYLATQTMPLLVLILLVLLLTPENIQPKILK